MPSVDHPFLVCSLNRNTKTIPILNGWKQLVEKHQRNSDIQQLERALELSAMKKVLSGKVHVPLRNLQLKEDSCVVTLCLWREAAIQQFSVGDHINVSHVKLSQSSYGPHLQSTSFSKVERKEEEMSEVHIIGVDTCDTPNQLEVLLENGSTLFIASNLWKPFEEEILKAKLTVAIKVKGKHIIEITQK
ncbi:hypothetical protein AMECASPLE_016386 [Ameca splendens]|uniref:Replication factor A1 n=1 Tax=Ameca splendens TaxID=208324 RepID=A0ABV0YPI2_9TELE